MKQFLPFIFAAFLFFFTIEASFSQDTSSVKKQKSHMEAGMKYLSRNVYLGRTDSAKISYISPSIGFFHKSGFHILGSVSYMPDNGANRIDVSQIEAGYDFTAGTHFYGGVYADQFFYNTGSFAVNAEIHTGIGMYAGYDLGWVTLNGGAGFSFSKASDLVTEAGLSHSFTADKERLEIAPDLRMKAGTQNYYNEYFTSGRASKSGVALAKSKGRGRGNGSSGSGTQVTTTATIESASQFTVLDYELSAPVSYKTGKWKFQVTPTFAIPVNPATVVNNQVLTKETIKNHFYEELEATFSF